MASGDNRLMHRTVLIVEDEDTCVSTLEIIVSALGVEIVTAASGRQAWALLENGAHNLAAVITDLEMAGMDGFELIERVRGHHQHRDIPIMVITGTSDPDAAERVRKLGANAFITKPFSAAVVREKLEEWLNHAKP